MVLVIKVEDDVEKPCPVGGNFEGIDVGTLEKFANFVVGIGKWEGMTVVGVRDIAMGWFEGLMLG